MRVLFVDDESAVLSGLQNALRRQRRVWDMEFALGGEVALSMLESKPFDIMVTDLRMPKINGPKLLRHAKTHYPSMARIVLSGNSNDECFAPSLKDSHAILKKPCNPDELKDTIHNLVQQKQDRQSLAAHRDAHAAKVDGNDT